MGNIYFADIAVYRLSQEQYKTEMGRLVKKEISTVYGTDKTAKEFLVRHPDKVENCRDRIWNAYGGWGFNEIVAHIRMYFSGTQILGEYCQIKAKRIRRTRTKVFDFVTWKLVSEIDIPLQATDHEIYQLISTYLSNCADKLSNRHIDTSHFDMWAPHVKWRDLLECHSLDWRRRVSGGTAN
jgi:hypothetical protein